MSFSGESAAFGISETKAPSTQALLEPLIACIEAMHMIRKGQIECHDGEVLSAVDQFYSLAF